MSQIYIHRPEIFYPKRHMKNVLPTLPLQTTPFRLAENLQDTHIATEAQVYSDKDNKVILTTEIDADTKTIQNIADLASFQKYYIRVRYKGKTYGWSGWSVWTAFTTCDRPHTCHILSPKQNSKDIETPLDIKISLPKYVHQHIQHTQHIATQYQLSHMPDFTDIIYDSGLSPDLMTHTLTQKLVPKTKHYLRVRQYRILPDQPTNRLVSDWQTITFTTAKEKGYHFVDTVGITKWTVPKNVTRVHAALKTTGSQTSSIGSFMSASLSEAVGHDGQTKDIITGSNTPIYILNAIPVVPGQVIYITLAHKDSFVYISWGYPKFPLT